MNFLRKYNYLIIIVVFIIILTMTYNSYYRTKEIIKSKYETQNKLVENSVINALANANSAYSISEKTLNGEMQYYSSLLLEEYNSNPDIKSWDLDKFKSLMNEYDIYIVDRNLKIIRTTFPPDLGLDFSKYDSFAKLLKSRIEGNRFIADKMDISTNTGKIKKYSYMPTPDHKYLIELSIDIINRYPVLKDLNVFSLARNLAKTYPSVEDISFYKFNQQVSTVGILKDRKNPIDTDIPEYDKVIVKEAILSDTTKSRTIKHAGYTLTYKYIPFLTKTNEGKTDWWNSYLVGIAYNNKDMLREIDQENKSFLITISIIAVVFLIFITVMIYLLRKTEYMAYHDHLTGLANRKALEKYFAGITKDRQAKLALLFIDLDDFKKINDNYGHIIGDKLLIAVGERLKNVIRTNDKVSRVGGDEFIILLTDINSRNDVMIVVEKLKKEIKRPFNIDGVEFTIKCSIGSSIFPEQGSSLEDLLNKADFTMYQTKNSNHS